ncbi:heme exporter protein CcmD [Roseiarcaceae bacterium H3SJ34-1]|uniref:heme exporter protein CcmD n=1 Tax=Terripilifer ovatus TaxID=3032367 RepID=UPI003AB948F6|nr:heme exporter protein CcmD [Roseiarcaceae bacterium H3SJ34-1]
MSDHAAYILAAYGLTVIVVLGVIAAIVIDRRRIERALERFPVRGAETDNRS